MKTFPGSPELSWVAREALLDVLARAREAEADQAADLDFREASLARVTIGRHDSALKLSALQNQIQGLEQAIAWLERGLA